MIAGNRGLMTDAQVIDLLSPLEREADEWRAVEAIEIDTSDFVPTFLPEEVSDVFHALEAGETPNAPLRARLSTGVDGWILEE